MDRMRLSFVLNDVSRRYIRRFEKRAGEISLTLPQCRTLVRLEGHEGASQARLAELAGVEPMMMVRIVDRMQSQGLLDRRPDPADRRARCVYLTAKARRLLREIWRCVDATRAEMFAGIGRREREAFFRVLERIHANVSALEEAPIDGAAPSAPAAARKRPAGKARSKAKA